MDNMAARLSSNLKRLFEAYCDHRGLKPSTVGLNATRDPRLYDKIKSGSGAFTVQTYDKVVAWFAADWPRQLEWPKDVARPTVEPREPIRRKRRSIGHRVDTTPAVGALIANWALASEVTLRPVLELELLLAPFISL